LLTPPARSPKGAKFYEFGLDAQLGAEFLYLGACELSSIICDYGLWELKLAYNLLPIEALDPVRRDLCNCFSLNPFSEVVDADDEEFWLSEG